MAEKFIIEDDGEYWLAEGQGTTKDITQAYQYTQEELDEHKYYQDSCQEEWVSKLAVSEIAGNINPPAWAKFKIGDEVEKVKGSQWHGNIVGYYSTTLTPHGYAVESKFEQGSVQIYPEAALKGAEDAE